MSNRRKDETSLSRVYRSASKEMPPATLDKAILAAAQSALETKRPRSTTRWFVPLSLAATVVLSIGLALRIVDQGPSEPRYEMPAMAPQAAPSSSPAVAAEPAKSLAKINGQPTDEVRREVATSGGAALEAKAAPKKDAQDALADSHQRKKNEESARYARSETAAPAAAASLATGVADIVSVTASGQPNAYKFTVSVRGPNAGCAHYVDWWEVVSEDGRLLYRQMLTYRQIDKQPFAVTGGPIAVTPNTVVWVRPHMSDHGYVGIAFKGSVAQGFAATPLPSHFADSLKGEPPQPPRCNP